jgi:tRNA(Ile2) C34 agmatinyltransferase TiaS
MSVKSGTQQLKDVKVLRSQGSVRKVRCQKCGGHAIEVSDGKGGSKFQCPNCKTEYRSTKL